MAKLIRCPAGHIYDREAHEACPECARTGVPKAAEQDRKALLDEDAGGRKDGAGKQDHGGKRSNPLPWLAIGGAAVVLIGVAGFFLFRPAGEEKGEGSGAHSGISAINDATSDANFEACRKTVGDDLPACERAIDSKKFSGLALATLYASRGAGHAKKREFDAGIADETEAIRIDPNFAPAFNNRGTMYRNQRKFDEALRDYDQAIKLDPRFSVAYVSRGGLYLDQGDFDRAFADFERAIQADAKFFRSYWARGDAYLKKGDRERAAADYKQAISLSPDEKVKKQIEAALAAATGGAPNAAPAAQPSSQASTNQGADPKSDADYGACEKASGDASITACDRAIASGKFAAADLGALYRYRGYAKSNAEKPDIDAAIADYGEAVRLEPNSFVPFVLRGIAYAGKGEPELAIKDYDRAIELNPRADFYNNRGNALRKTRAFDRAIADLDQAIKLEPNYSSAYWTRGLIYRDKGDKEKAADDYKKALSLNPSEDAKKEIEALLKGVTAEDASQPATSSQATPPQQAGAGNSGTAADDTGKGKEPEPAPNSKVLKSTEEMFADPDFKACKAFGSSQVANCDRAIASGKFEGQPLAMLYNNRGQARGNEDGALEDFNKSIELNPNGAVAYNSRGVFLVNRKEYDRALADFDKAIEHNATLPFPYQGRGLVYWKKGDLERAAADLKKALSLNPPPQLKELIERELKEIEAGAKPTPGPEPAQKQGSGATPPDDKNSALSAVREGGGSGDTSGLPSATEPGSTSQASADQTNDGTKAQLPKSGPWAAIATDEKGGWGSAVGQPSREAAENAALEGCGSGCKVIGDRALKGSCLAYAESRQGGYWYFAWIGPNESNVQSNALNGCNKAAPAGSCKILKSICAPVPGSVPQASADSKKDGDSCMGEIQLEAIPACDRAIASGTFGVLDLAALHGRRGGLHAAGGNADAAIGDLSEAIRLNPSNASYFGNRAVMYNARNEYDKAIADLDKAIQLAPTDSSYHQNRGFAYFKKGDKMQAQLNYNLALKLWPDAEHKKQIEQALKEIETGEKSTSGSAPAQKQAPQASADPKKDAESCMNTFGGDAMAACDRAIASGHFGKLDLGTLHNQRGVLHLMKQRDDDAIAEFSEAIRLDDSLAKYFNHRGYAYFAKGDYDKAIADFDQAIKRAPESSSGYKGRAQSYLKKGLPGPARDDYTKALSLNPDADARKEIEETLKELGPDPRKMKMQ